MSSLPHPYAVPWTGAPKRQSSIEIPKQQKKPVACFRPLKRDTPFTDPQTCAVSTLTAGTKCPGHWVSNGAKQRRCTVCNRKRRRAAVFVERTGATAATATASAATRGDDDKASNRAAAPSDVLKPKTKSPFEAVVPRPGTSPDLRPASQPAAIVPSQPLHPSLSSSSSSSFTTVAPSHAKAPPVATHVPLTQKPSLSLHTPFASTRTERPPNKFIGPFYEWLEGQQERVRPYVRQNINILYDRHNPASSLTQLAVFKEALLEREDIPPDLLNLVLLNV